MLGVVRVNVVHASSLPSSLDVLVFLLELFDVLLQICFDRMMSSRWDFRFLSVCLFPSCCLSTVWHVRSEIS